MCYAIPAKILEMDGEIARVDYGGVIKKVNISLVDDAKTGDSVLIHAGFAIEKLDKKSAEEAMETIRRDLSQFSEEDFRIKEEMERWKKQRSI
ncbi:MAG: HypC/HybG/HupF family hydrogenase formation chaperone [Nanobdellota archaeon]